MLSGLQISQGGQEDIYIEITHYEEENQWFVYKSQVILLCQCSNSVCCLSACLTTFVLSHQPFYKVSNSFAMNKHFFIIS